MMNAFATAISIGLQYGVPLETFVKKFSYMRFDPEGMTTNPEIPFAKSLPDYIMRWLASRFLDPSVHEELGIMSEQVRAKKMAEEAAPAHDSGNGGNGGNGHANGHSTGEPKDSESQAPTAALTDTPPVVPARMAGLDLGPACSQCGGMMQRTGSCYTCSSCGNNTGCG
jgi:ribonucleoside-diphosphate reductase alpha chain